MKYNIILADPTWNYDDKCHAGRRGASYKYNILILPEVMALPVPEITADNAVLFLWATFPMINEALAVMDAWGFRYKTIGFLWAKMNKISPTPFMGMGNWTRSNTEPCLMGIKGKPKRVNASVRSLIIEPIRRHSEKPPIVRDKIVELMGNLPRIELFARQSTPGWDAWGNEVTGRTEVFG
jgi:site-specific DNA-methyltransferase (adenine-specific)